MSSPFCDKDFKSNDGMLTSVWGPSMWHSLHTISFNYPVKPTQQQQDKYYRFFMSLKDVLPCKYCRQNLPKNMAAVEKSKNLSLKKALKSRAKLSRWVYYLHNQVNCMLGKTNKLTYKQVRNRYENFRARCSLKDSEKELEKCKKEQIKEKGCTEPLLGVKSKCILMTVPKNKKCESFIMHPKCMVKK
tara:strand:+ start:371 stop:934 length:564 start_codon:yes stop_codon:yes gene_type:complete